MPAGSSLIAIFDIARRSDGQGLDTLDTGERSDRHARFMSKVLLLTLPYMSELVSRLRLTHGCRFSEGRGGAKCNTDVYLPTLPYRLIIPSCIP